MTRRFVDLSVALDATPSERLPVEIERFDHRDGARQMSELFAVPEAALPDGLGWAGEMVRLSTHAGTHMDAPWHYGPRSDGSAAAQVAEVPLEWCYGPGVVLDLTHLEDGAEVLPGDLVAALERCGHDLRPGDIVLLRTGADAAWGTPDYPDRGCGLGGDGLRWLVARGVRVIGTDAWGLDRPFWAMRRDLEEGRTDALWAAHFAGREHPYCQLEKLTGLHRLPADGFTVICFPVKVHRAGAGWARVVALLEGEGS